jgi:hypothetical protein
VSPAKPADAAVADMLPMDLPAHPDPTENPEAMANPDNPVTMDNPDKALPHSNNPTGASTATLDHPDLPEITETPATPEDPDNPETPGKAAAKDHPALLDPLDPTETPVNLEAPDNPANLVNSPKFPAPKDHPDLLDNPDNPETMDNPAILAILEALDNPDHKEMLEAPANPEIPATQAPLETMESLADTEAATTALLLVPLPDIKRHIQLSQDYRQATIFILLFKFCSNFAQKF